MPDRARVTHPNAVVMLTTGRIRVPTTPVAQGVSWTEFAPDGWEVEIVPNPEPEWAEGDVVQDAVGNVFVRTPAGRWREVLGQPVEPVRPLVRLVPQA